MSTLIFALLLALGCRKEPPPVVEPPPPPTDTIMQLLWHKPFTEGYYQPVLSSGLVGFQDFTTVDLNFSFRDTATGEEVWRWGGEIPGLASSSPSKSTFCKDGDVYFPSSWDNIVALDLESKTMKWHSLVKPPGSGTPMIKMNYEHIYHAHSTGSWATSLVRTKLDTPNWDTMYTLVSAQWQTILRLPTEFITTQGDTLVIFIESQLEKVTNRGRINMVALNTKTRQTVWRLDDFEPEGNCNVQYLEIHNGRIYKLGESRVWCINAETGQIIWYRDFDPNNYGDEHFMGNNYALIHGNRIYAKGGYKHMEALDLETGQVIWQTDGALSAHYCLYEYKDKYIIYARQGNGGIAVHRMSDGALAYKNNKIAWGAIFSTDIAVDNANNRIYWADGKFAYCFRLNLP